MIKNYIEEQSVDIILSQETAGSKGGYNVNKRNRVTKINGYKNIAKDKHGITAIYIKDDLDNYINVDASHLFAKPEQTLHITIFIIFIEKKLEIEMQLY